MVLNVQEQLTINNLIPVMKESFPELGALFAEHQQDLEGESAGLSFIYVFCPFLKEFLNSEQQHPHLLGKRLFAYLESMAQSSDRAVTTLLAYTVLEGLSQKQLEVAKIYMGLKTKETLKQVEEFWEKVGTWQAWFNAIEYNDIQQVKLLLDQGFDINSKNHDGCTALHIAAYRGHQDIIELLLKRGADTFLKDKDGYTARMYAQEYGHSEIVELLEHYEKKLC